MRVIKAKMSNHFFTRILRDEIDLSSGELPKDVKVAAAKAKLDEDWFWIYLTSKEFMDVDPDFDFIPELTLWFGGNKK
ncbi:MAG: hypothetical protein LC687_01990 [Actinobacteria bacterium]|nr:hypothetical protein [Actinomycetota bacterium]MCA1806623.1 hypothetical protein [Actinomycetota bacterium]